ncbi:Protein GrpE [bioreactor metagenome]|uniref:Protein GrpE n=1 Tax=bioreactor metagenome TaxID=1076179 RepID=A0A645FKX1_9ZZZZ
MKEEPTEKNNPKAEPEKESAESKDDTAANENAQANAESEIPKKDEPDYKDLYIRLLAEFDNYKKRLQREKEGIGIETRASTVMLFLPVLDNLDRALSHKEESEESLAKGLELTCKQFEEALKKLGVTEIETQGKPFDPNLHNAVMHIEDETFGDNTVIEVLQKGYELNGRVIRHSMVKVAN